jgi:Hypothetical protein (DUF2513)
MKRDVDLIRQILLDLERHGAEFTLDALRNGTTHEIDERSRYHLRLCIDAGLAKEIDRTAAGSPCVRLTNAGHEFLDICRGDDRWQAAKWIVHQQTGGLSLAVLRAVLTKWAIQGNTRGERPRRYRRAYRPQFAPEYYAGEPASAGGGPLYRVDSYRYEREPYFDDEPMRLVRPRRDYREALGPIEHWEHEPHPTEELLADEPLGVSLPINII